MHHDERLGHLVSGVNTARIPCDFMAIHEGQLTLARVKRIRYARYGLPDIAASCRREILELRGTPVSENTSRELWVRGPGRHWHGYVISPERIDVSDWDIFGVRASRILGRQMF